ncbi:MAG TPA: PucR family transcriptional regulator ligand-binding domain-containing protein [Pseudolysinimonas sp.]|nr:PucR family transcriptional regulator ligand-binding domain-containing protein [Pseudolysinimonas sp.]
MTAVTVREILTLPVLAGSTVLAGQDGLARPVSGVNVMEVPDIESFVRAGELMLTTAYPLRDHPEDLGDLVRTLSRRGLAALAVKSGRYLDEVPPAMIEVADELGFPLIALTGTTSFNDVIGAVLAVVLSEYGPDPAGAEAIRERLTGVALSGGGLDEIARALAGALDRQVRIIDDAGVPLVHGGHESPEPTEDAPWEFPITVGGTERGRLLVHGRDEPTLGQRRLIRQACFAAGMHIAQAVAGLELDRRMRVLHLEELVSGRSSDADMLRQRSRLFGFAPDAARTVIIARCAAEPGEGRLDEGLPPGSIVWSRGSESVALVPADADANQAATAWRAALQQSGGGATVVAVGTRSDDLDGLARSHAAARESLTIAEATGQSVVRYELLAVERAILALPREQLAELVEQELGVLIRADAASDGQLCATLEMHLGTGNAAEASRRMFIHYNTMKHRLGRIEELLGPVLEDPRKRLSLAFALHARKFL